MTMLILINKKRLYIIFIKNKLFIYSRRIM